ncbi:formin-binding protein [Coemansia sp. RSA 1972]|nr:formin-binding protein [Coemansia sp. RSA 1972]
MGDLQSEASGSDSENECLPVERRAVVVGPSTDDADDAETEEPRDPLADYDDDETCVELMHARLTTLSDLELERFTSLEYLGLRQNLIVDMSLVSTLSPTLRDLDLYDNRIKRITGLDASPSLQSLDLSFNKIRTIENLDALQDLKELFLVSNRIHVIENLSALRSLTYLELGANRIRTIQGLDELTELEQLFLGKNKISRLENLSSLKKLRVLSIQSNRIVAIEGLEELTNLEELYLSHNGISEISGLDANTKLTILDVTSNQLTRLSNITHLQVLEDLWASGNQLTQFDNIEAECAVLPELRTVYFEFNPVQRTQPANYRRKLMLALPQITQIDATKCRSEPSMTFVFGKLGKDEEPTVQSPTKQTVHSTVKSTGSVAETQAEMPADFVCSTRFADHFWSTDERCISVLMHKLKSAKQTCTDILHMATQRAQMEEDLGKRMAKLARAGLGTEEVGETKAALRTVRAEMESTARVHTDLAKQIRTEIERPLSAFISDQRAKRRAQTSVIQKTEGDRNTLRSQLRKLQDKRRTDTKRVGDLDLQVNGLQGSGDPKLRAKLERAQMQQRSTESEYTDVRERLKEADAQWYNVWRSACDVFQILEEERVEQLKTTLWAYTNLVSACCVADDESMERIRQDLEKISVADDISEFIRTFGTGAPDPGLTRASTQESGDRTSKAETSDDEGPAHGSAVPVPTSHSAQGNAQSNAMNSMGPNNAMNTVGSNSNAMNTVGSNSQSMNTLNSSSSYNAPNGNMRSVNGTARSGSIATARPQTQESMHQRPVSMHAQASVQPMMNGHSPGWNGRPTSAMHGAAPDASYRRASNNDMYGMANGMQMQPQQQPQFVQRTNSQMAMRGPETPPGYVYVNNMDPRAPSSMSAYRANGGTNSPVPMASQPPSNMNAYRASGNAQMANQQRPGTPSQMDAYGVPRMESPRSRAGTFNAPAHTGTFGTLTGTAQMQPFAGHGSGSAPGSPYQQQPSSRPSSAMGGAQISGSPHMGNARPVSVMQQPQYVMQQPYRAATPVQQQPQYVPMSRPPTQMSHSPVPQMHPQMGAPSPHMHQRAPSVMGGAYSMPPSQQPPQPQQQPHMMQQRSMSRVEQSGNSVSESGKEILFYVKVLYDYDADNGKELTIREGDVISVLAVSADGWWEGEMTDRRTGRPIQGTFPSNFTDPISNLISQ